MFIKKVGLAHLTGFKNLSGVLFIIYSSSLFTKSIEKAGVQMAIYSHDSSKGFEY